VAQDIEDADLRVLYQAAAHPGWHRRRDTYASRRSLPEQP
jgi:hypothetical protein